MIELVWDIRVINVLAKFENDSWKIVDVIVLTGLVCPATRPPTRLGKDNTPGALKGCGVKRCVQMNPILKTIFVLIYTQCDVIYNIILSSSCNIAKIIIIYTFKIIFPFTRTGKHVYGF